MTNAQIAAFNADTDYCREELRKRDPKFVEATEAYHTCRAAMSPQEFLAEALENLAINDPLLRAGADASVADGMVCSKRALRIALNAIAQRLREEA